MNPNRPLEPMVSIGPGLMTVEDLWKLPDDNLRHELVRGELRTGPLAGFEHGIISSAVGALLFEYTRSPKLGKVVIAAGFISAREPDTVRVPDLGFVSQLRLDQIGIPKQFFPGAPDLAVEVVSPSDTLEELEEKVDDFFAAGTQLVWVVNPRRRSVTVHRPGPRVSILKEPDQLTGEDVVPGFACTVSELFIKA
jgi:Uma2 family endonuclease